MDSDRDMVMMKNGKMIMMKDREMFLMEEDVITADGTLIRVDGSIILPDGTTSRLEENEAVAVDLVLTRRMEL